MKSCEGGTTEYLSSLEFSPVLEYGSVADKEEVGYTASLSLPDTCHHESCNHMFSLQSATLIHVAVKQQERCSDIDIGTVRLSRQEMRGVTVIPVRLLVSHKLQSFRLKRRQTCLIWVSGCKNDRNPRESDQKGERLGRNCCEN